MGWADAGEALGLGLDHGAEVVPPPCALLLKVGAKPNGVRCTYGRSWGRVVGDGLAGCRRSGGFGLDHCAEAVSAPCTLLLKVGADFLQVFVGDGFVQQVAVSVCARF